MLNMFSLEAKKNASGIFWKLIACVSFAITNASVRYLTGGAGTISSPLSPIVIIFFQNLFAASLIFIILCKYETNDLRTKKIKIHIFRIISAIIGIICFYTALAKMPITQVVILQFTGPLFTVVGAKIYLNESIGKRRLLGIMAGFVGALLITRPDKLLQNTNHDFNIYTTLPLIAAICFAVAKLCSRNLASQGESPTFLTFLLLIFLVPVSGIMAMLNWQTPSVLQLFHLFLLGVINCLAHYATVKAYSYSEVNFLAPFGFSRIIFTGLLGFIIFGEYPQSTNSWYGIVLIVTSVILITMIKNVTFKKNNKK